MKKRLLIHASWPICFIWITLFLNTPCTGQYLDLNCENKDFEEKVIDLSPFCPPIISQGQLNSCTGYGNGYYAMSLMYNKALNITDTLLKSKFAFSANFPYDLIEGKTGAVNPTHVLHNLKTIGNVRYNEYDLLPPSDKMSEKAKSKYLSDASKFKIISYQSILDPENNKKGSVTRSASIDKIKCALLNGFPVTANISQTATFFNLKIKTYTPITNDIFVGEHMITIIGYNNESERFHLVNSYGLNWGENGFAYIGYFDLLDMINYAYIFNINSEKEALQHYETLLAPENNLPGICNEQNTVHLDKNIFLASKPFESAIKMNNISIVASEQYIDGNIITLQRELKDKNKNENIYLKKLSPEGTILASTQILSPLLKKENVLHSAKIKAATDGSITIVFTTFDGANYYTYFTHYDFRLQELRKVTHLMDSQGKEFTPVSNIILEKHIMHFVTHDNYFYLYKYNIRTKEISKSIINYEDLKDPLVSLRVSGLEREVQNLHLNKTLDDQFLVFGTYEVKKQEEQNGFNLIIDRQFEKYLHFAEIKELRFNKLIYIQSVLPINKQEFLLAGNIGCEPFLYLSEISANKEIKVLKKYDLITPVQIITLL
jgi:cathepsin K